MTEAMKLVPVEPTPEMIAAGNRMEGQYARSPWQERFRQVWSAMLQASPIDAGDRTEDVRRIVSEGLAEFSSRARPSYSNPANQINAFTDAITERLLQALIPIRGKG